MEAWTSQSGAKLHINLEGLCWAQLHIRNYHGIYDNKINTHAVFLIQLISHHSFPYCGYIDMDRFYRIIVHTIYTSYNHNPEV